MFSPADILAWVDKNVKGVRKSRRKTLAAIVPAAMQLCGLGVLALGRAMLNGTSAKHNIKRVNRFLGNAALECEVIAEGIFCALAPAQGPVVVLADWTDMPNAKLLVFALPRQGRALPFYVQVIQKEAQSGEMIAAEEKALEALSRICRKRSGQTMIMVADRGFGNRRWIQTLRDNGWHVVQRLARSFFADVESYIGKLQELTVRRGSKPKDWGKGSFAEAQEIKGRLITVYDREGKEPWYLVTSLEKESAKQVVELYRKRMWIEALFRDQKNRDWGMSMAAVELKHHERYERLFYIVALAFIFLSAYGAAAEQAGFDRGFKANTRAIRVINLIRVGFHYALRRRCDFQTAIAALMEAPT